MRYITLFIAAVWLACGIAIVYAPQALAGWMGLVMIPAYIRYWAVLPLIIGIIFLIGASRFHLSVYLRIIGALSILKGLFFLFAPMAMIERTLDWYATLPPLYVRIGGFFSIALAIIVGVLAFISLFEEDVV